MDNWTTGFPDPEELQGTGFLCNYHLIGDDAFPLKPDIMRPFPFRQHNQEQHVVNFRLSRARCVVENAFGILANRFRVFLAKIALPNYYFCNYYYYCLNVFTVISYITIYHWATTSSLW